LSFLLGAPSKNGFRWGILTPLCRENAKILDFFSFFARESGSPGRFSRRGPPPKSRSTAFFDRKRKMIGKMCVEYPPFFVQKRPKKIDEFFWTPRTSDALVKKCIFGSQADFGRPSSFFALGKRRLCSDFLGSFDPQTQSSSEKFFDPQNFKTFPAGPFCPTMSDKKGSNAKIPQKGQLVDGNLPGVKLREFCQFLPGGSGRCTTRTDPCFFLRVF
jgi:hypothetical protein